MKILVSGSRDFKDFLFLDEILDTYLDRVTKIIQGGADGVDQLAKDWACMNYIPCVTYPAKWKKYGKPAGSIRNQQMLDEEHIDLVIALPSQKSIGTWDMIRRAKAKDIEYLIYKVVV